MTFFYHFNKKRIKIEIQILIIKNTLLFSRLNGDQDGRRPKSTSIPTRHSSGASTPRRRGCVVWRVHSKLVQVYYNFFSTWDPKPQTQGKKRMQMMHGKSCSRRRVGLDSTGARKLKKKKIFLI